MTYSAPVVGDALAAPMASKHCICIVPDFALAPWNVAANKYLLQTYFDRILLELLLGMTRLHLGVNATYRVLLLHSIHSVVLSVLLPRTGKIHPESVDRACFGKNLLPRLQPIQTRRC